MTVAIVPNTRTTWYDPQLAAGEPVVIQNINYATGDNNSVMNTVMRFFQDISKRWSATSIRSGFGLTGQGTGTINVASGYAIVDGRHIYNDSTDTVDVSGEIDGDYYIVLTLTQDSEAQNRDPENDSVALSAIAVGSFTAASEKLVLGKITVASNVASVVTSYAEVAEVRAGAIMPPQSPDGSSLSEIKIFTGETEKTEIVRFTGSTLKYFDDVKARFGDDDDADIYFNSGFGRLQFDLPANGGYFNGNVTISGLLTMAGGDLDINGNSFIMTGSLSNWDNTYYPIQFGDTAIASNSSNDIMIINNAYYDATDLRWEYIETGYALRIYNSHNDGIMNFQGANSGTANTPISWSNLLSLDQQNSVATLGIDLDLNGNYITDILGINSTSGDTILRYFENGNVRAQINYDISQNELEFQVRNSADSSYIQAMKISGETDTPVISNPVNNSGYYTGAANEGRFYFTGSNTVLSSTNNLYIDIDSNKNATTNNFRITKDGTATTLFLLNESGNIGFNTTSSTLLSPGTDLHVIASPQSNLYFGDGGNPSRSLILAANLYTDDNAITWKNTLAGVGSIFTLDDDGFNYKYATEDTVDTDAQEVVGFQFLENGSSPTAQFFNPTQTGTTTHHGIMNVSSTNREEAYYQLTDVGGNFNSYWQHEEGGSKIFYLTNLYHDGSNWVKDDTSLGGLLFEHRPKSTNSQLDTEFSWYLNDGSGATVSADFNLLMKLTGTTFSMEGVDLDLNGNNFDTNGGYGLIGTSVQSSNALLTMIDNGRSMTDTQTISHLVIGNSIADTVDWTGGTSIAYRMNSIVNPTLTANVAKSISSAYTWYIEGAPISGTNVTINNAYSLYINSGLANFGGGAIFGDDLDLNGNDIDITSGDSKILTGSSSLAIQQSTATGSAGRTIFDVASGVTQSLYKWTGAGSNFRAARFNMGNTLEIDAAPNTTIGSHSWVTYIEVDGDNDLLSFPQGFSMGGDLNLNGQSLFSDGSGIDITEDVLVGDSISGSPVTLKVLNNEGGSAGFLYDSFADNALMMRVQSNMTTPSTSDTFIGFYDNTGSVIGDIDGDGTGDVRYNTFTGAHKSQSQNYNDYWEYGMIVSSTGERIEGDTKVYCDLSSSFKDSGVLGVFTNDDSEVQKRTEYKRDKNGQIELNEEGEPIIIQKGTKYRGMEENKSVLSLNALGEGLILVTNKFGNVKKDDYITSSEMKGIGTAQGCNILHSYTVAKVTQNIDWDNIDEHPKFGAKVALVTCTYHSG